MKEKLICAFCWWCEGNRCYANDPTLNSHGQSLKKIKPDDTCKFFQDKRAMLEQYFSPSTVHITDSNTFKNDK